MNKEAAGIVRQKLSFDIEDDYVDQKKPRPEDLERKAKKIGEQAGFTAGSPTKGLVQENSVVPVRRARARTGRTHAFNTRIKPETYQDICDLADQATQQEDRPVSLAEIIERGIEALKEKNGY
jgi:hypothetical protein